MNKFTETGRMLNVYKHAEQIV